MFSCLFMVDFLLLRPLRKNCIPYSRVLEGQHLSMHPFPDLALARTSTVKHHVVGSSIRSQGPVGRGFFHISTARFKERKRTKKKETAATIEMSSFFIKARP